MSAEHLEEKVGDGLRQRYQEWHGDELADDIRTWLQQEKRLDVPKRHVTKWVKEYLFPVADLDRSREQEDALGEALRLEEYADSFANQESKR